MKTLSGRALFAHIAPRLERAHRERKAEMVVERHERGRARALELKAERLVSHRELQLLRAATTKSRNYYFLRFRKLEDARKQLLRAQNYSRELGC